MKLQFSVRLFLQQQRAQWWPKRGASVMQRRPGLEIPLNPRRRDRTKARANRRGLCQQKGPRGETRQRLRAQKIEKRGPPTPILLAKEGLLANC